MSECAVTVAVDPIASRILTLRRQRVIVDADLAARYGVETRRLNEQVKRSAERCRAEFMSQLTSVRHVSEQDQLVAVGCHFLLWPDIGKQLKQRHFLKRSHAQDL
jgi:hypothetical protein